MAAKSTATFRLLEAHVPEPRSAVSDNLLPLDPIWIDDSCIPEDDLHAESLLPAGKDSLMDNALATAAANAYQEKHAAEMLPQEALNILLISLSRGSCSASSRAAFIRDALGGRKITAKSTSAIVAAAEKVHDNFGGTQASCFLVPYVVDVWNMDWDGMDMNTLCCISGHGIDKLNIKSVRDIEALHNSTAWQLYKGGKQNKRICCDVSAALRCSNAMAAVRTEAFVTACGAGHDDKVQSIVLHSPVITGAMIAAGAKHAAAVGRDKLMCWLLEDERLTRAFATILQGAGESRTPECLRLLLQYVPARPMQLWSSVLHWKVTRDAFVTTLLADPFYASNMPTPPH